MIEKYKLNLIVASTILLITIGLIRARVVGDFVGNLLSGGAIALIIWTLLKNEKKPAKLLGFFVKSLLISYVATSIIWLSVGGLEGFIDTLVAVGGLYGFVLPLFPVAISVIIYGIFRIKLTAWEFFLSSWYVSMFIVFAGYYGWWYPLYVEPYLPEFSYSAPGAGIAFILFLLFPLAFLIAGILTIVYVILKKQKMKTQ